MWGNRSRPRKHVNVSTVNSAFLSADVYMQFIVSFSCLFVFLCFLSEISCKNQNEIFSKFITQNHVSFIQRNLNVGVVTTVIISMDNIIVNNNIQEREHHTCLLLPSALCLLLFIKCNFLNCNCFKELLCVHERWTLYLDQQPTKTSGYQKYVSLMTIWICATLIASSLS